MLFYFAPDGEVRGGEGEEDRADGGLEEVQDYGEGLDRGEVREVRGRFHVFLGGGMVGCAGLR